MRNLLRCRRGSVAFATVIALVPLIGVVALGAEAGSWYVTKQAAQNAADAAAYSGALALACTNSGGSCDNTQTVDYRGKQFAAQNAFCASGDSIGYPGRACPASLPTGTSQAVQIAIGDYNAGTFTTPPASTGNAVRATVSQTQPGYLAAVLKLTTVTIGGQAIAQVQNPKDLCALSLGPDPGGGGALKLGGSSSNNGTGCGMMSNGSVQFASSPTFSGSGWAVLGATGCSPTGTCAGLGVTHNYFMPPAWDPLQGLKGASFNSTTGSTSPCNPSGNVTNGKTCNLSPLSTGAYGGLSVNSGGTLNLAAGTYFFYNANINFNGGTVTGTDVTLVLLGSSSLSINGGTVNLSAPTTNTFSSALNGVLIDDQTTANVNIGGNGVIKLGGAMYFPKADVSFGGTVQPTNTTCSEVIAKTLNMSGGAYLSTTGCVPGVVARTQVVALVQ
jgi:Flp pilus assembly protein TadG